jgi:hypothetical protein
MSDELEAAGALATAGLIAGRADGAAAHGSAPGGSCANCGASVSGAFCPACGQAAHVHRSLLHLTEEVLHGVLHFDAKGWRTLPLLVARPGLLTRRYIDGQRMRHVSPLALFLFTVFLMFFVFSLTTSAPSAGIAAQAGGRAEVADSLKEADAAVGEAEAELARVRQRAADATDAEADLAAARAGQTTLRVALQAIDAAAVAASRAAPAPANAASAQTVVITASDPSRWMRALRGATIDTGSARLDAAIRRAIDNPELTLYKLKNTAYKFSFMLVPISLPFLWLMFFWRRGIAVYDHAVFSLYSLSFMSLLFIAIALLSVTPAKGVIPALVFVVPPVHMALQLRETYGLGWFSTLWRTVALLIVSATVFLLFLLFIVAVTMG